MSKNMGTVDRAVRTVVALVLGWLYFTGRIPGWLGIVLLLVAIMFLVTSFVGVCPGYLPFNCSTRGKAAS